MAKLTLMHDDDYFMKYRETVWETKGGGGPLPQVVDYLRYPCFVKCTPVRYLNSTGMFTIRCSKAEAKRIVYPKTNKFRSREGFIVIEGENLLNAMSVYITNTLERVGQRENVGIDTAHPTQRRLLDVAMSDLDGAKGLALVISRTYHNLDRLKLINFYTVDEADARRLVYLGKEPKKDINFEQFVREYEHHHNRKHYYKTG